MNHGGKGTVAAFSEVILLAVDSNHSSSLTTLPLIAQALSMVRDGQPARERPILNLAVRAPNFVGLQAASRADLRSILHGGMHHPTLRTYQNNGRNLTKAMFMYPIFISDDPEAEQVISTLPGQKRWGINKLEGFLTPLVQKGLKAVILFGVPMQMVKVGAQCDAQLIPGCSRKRRRRP